MGIIDMCIGENPWEITTCSNDRTLKTWKIDLEAKTIEQVKEYTLSDYDLTGYKENLEKQQLGVAYNKIEKSFYGISMNSDINVWKENESEKPVNTIRGHQAPVLSCAVFQDKLIISGDTDGRILAWDPKTGLATRPTGTYKLKIAVSKIVSNSKYVYVGCNDFTLMQLKPSEVENTLESIEDSIIKKSNEIIQMITNEDVLYVLYADKTIEALKADLITEVIAKSDKLDSLGGKGEVSSMGLCAVNGELWLGDNKGKIHIYDAATLKKKEDCDLTTEYEKPVTMIGSSNDQGKIIAVGDKDGYVTIFDATTKSKKCYVAYNSKRVSCLEFTKDDSLLCTLSIDKMVTLGNPESKAKPIKLARPNGMKDVNDCCILNQDGVNYLFTAGHDQSIRMFKHN